VNDSRTKQSWINRLLNRPAPAPSAENDFSARLITVQEEERKRLSRELHDGVGQIITALKMELSRVKGAADESDAVRLQRARAHADEALATIRNVSRLLRPTLLDDLGLEAALQWHVEDFGRRTGIHSELFYQLPSVGSLSDAVNTCVYRTVQEALNNCEKHSAARQVTVTVSDQPDGMWISVSDDGRGLRSGLGSQDQYGIRGMRERAHILGGKLQVESEVGKGTTVILNLPHKAPS
jgi:signal transduction histidine kinase